MNRHIVIIGKTGQLARALTARAAAFGFKVSCYGRQECDLSGSETDITDFAVNLPQCDGLIIAAAYTAVDMAEDDEQTARQVNGAAPGVFAKICQQRNIPLVHVSTDYVFQGNDSAPLKPDMPTDPINAYGRSKLAGEIAITHSGARAVILRSSWVFDGTGKNFLTTMLRLGDTQDEISVVADQIGRPTYAGHLADACFTVMGALLDDTSFGGGIYHVSGSGEAISWAGFAAVIFNAVQDERMHNVVVRPIPTSEYPMPARRPGFSVLDMASFEQQFGMKMPDWKDGLIEALKERSAGFTP